MPPLPIDEALDNLGAKVEKLTSAKDAIVAYVKGLAPILEANKNAPDKISAIASTIDADADEIMGQIVAGTEVPPPVA